MKLRMIINNNKWNSDDVIYVGDSKGDIGAGLNQGAYTIAYLGNPDKVEQLKACKATREVYDLGEIIEILQEKHYFTYNLK